MATLGPYSVPLLRQPIRHWQEPIIKNYRERVYWQSIMLINGRRTIKDIAHLLNLPWVDVCVALRRLEDAGIVLDAEEAAAFGLFLETAKQVVVGNERWSTPTRPKTLWNTLVYWFRAGGLRLAAHYG